MLEPLIDQFAEVIEQPVELVRTWSAGWLEEDRPVFSVSVHPGTPLVLSFGEIHAVCSCCSGSTINIRLTTKEIDAVHGFSEKLDEEITATAIPIYPLLEGPHGDYFYGQKMFLDSASFIARHRERAGLAAVVFSFHDSVRFAVSAAHESHFCYLFNDYCDQLINEAEMSPQHSVHTVRRHSQSPRLVKSLLWMIE